MASPKQIRYTDAAGKEYLLTPDVLPVAGNLVKYIDVRGMEHTALVLEVKVGGALKIKVFKQPQNQVIEVSRNQWRRL